ncbi:MAG TPA: hypothetical protein VKZ18_29165 [Polyangia bacterium]|nr:hypothetical protein [Polyangia bacterium]
MAALGLGMVVAVALLAQASSTAPQSNGLSGLDRALGDTGRIGVYTPSPAGQIQPPAVEADSAARPLEKPAERAAPESSTRRPGLVEEELRPTEARVGGCRLEVARRRQISPSKLAAREVVLRFTVQPDGRVRDAEAISAPDTDLEVAACAKRVLSEWVFARHHGDPIAVERTYRFR